MSGVCRSVGTFEITSKPRKIASTRIVTSKTSSVSWLMFAPGPGRPGPHRLDGRSRDDLRRRPAGDRGGRDHCVEVRDPSLERLLLRGHLIRRQLARVSALGLGAGHAEVEPVRSEALDLLPHDRTY